jgi:dihydrofolate reductase
VLTSEPIPGVECYPTPEAALNALKDQEKVFVIGGGKVYSEMIRRSDELYLTFVDLEVEGDTYFERYDGLLRDEFIVVHREKHPGYEFVDYVRATAKGNAP